MQKKKVKCPLCHQLIEVSNPDNAEQLVVVCPTPTCSARLRVTFATGQTVLTKSTGQETASGYLLFDGNRYSLKEGLNIIGREADSSDADVQLPTDKRYVSRKHIGIELVRLKKGTTKCIIRDLRDEEKIAQKATLVNGEKLELQDRIVLKHGDTIEVGELKIMFHTK